MKLIAATNNHHKVREFSQILSPLGFEIISAGDAGINCNPEENGSTFEENAVIKASAFSKECGLPVIADDSGLEVDFLNGAPGIYSARYAEGSDSDRVNKLLNNLRNAENRSARFISAVAIAYPDGRIITAEGKCEGCITYEPKGENGFGYDPVFFVKQFGKTFAQLSADEKNSISHRNNALKLLCSKLLANK